MNLDHLSIEKYCPNMHAVTFGSASLYEMRLCDICEKNLGKEKGVQLP
jgi:hypothetical protein